MKSYVEFLFSVHKIVSLSKRLWTCLVSNASDAYHNKQILNKYICYSVKCKNYKQIENFSTLE